MTTHTDLIARLRAYPTRDGIEAADALESLEQQVAALTKERDASITEAQVKVLREAAEMIRCKRNVGDVFRAEAELIRVADELEKADAIRGLA